MNLFSSFSIQVNLLLLFCFAIEPLSQLDQPSSSSMPTWMLILCICGAIIGLGLMLYGAVHLFLYLTSEPQNVAVPPVQKNSEEMELFCPENV